VHPALEQQDIISNPLKDVEKRKGIQVAELLLSHHPDVVFVRRTILGRASMYTFEAAGVEVRVTDAGWLSEVIDQMIGLHGEDTDAQHR